MHAEFGWDQNRVHCRKCQNETRNRLLRKQSADSPCVRVLLMPVFQQGRLRRGTAKKRVKPGTDSVQTFRHVLARCRAGRTRFPCAGTLSGLDGFP